MIGLPEDFYTWLKKRYGEVEARRRYEKWREINRNKMKEDKDEDPQTHF